MLAIRAAVDCGAGGVEIDIHLTQDKQLILQHDATLDRMTNGTGLVSEHPWHGHIDGLKTRNSETPEPVALLSQVFDYLLSVVPVGFALVLDVKDDQSLSVLDELDRLLQKYPNYQEKLRIYLGVWRDDFTLHARSLFTAPSAPLLTLIAERCELSQMALYDAFNLDVDQITPEILKEAACTGKDVLLWTCNSAEQVDKAKALQIQGILTDDPLSV